jgi:hypothetical protein
MKPDITPSRPSATAMDNSISDIPDGDQAREIHTDVLAGLVIPPILPNPLFQGTC